MLEYSSPQKSEQSLVLDADGGVPLGVPPRRAALWLVASPRWQARRLLTGQ
jgi:hypothetical protein